MSAIPRNILANALGGGWIVALNLLVIPVQVRILGTEAYGMLGVLAALQLFFAVLDLGGAATLVQRAAADATPQRRMTRELFGAAIGAYGLTALASAGLLAAAAGWVSTQWMQRSSLPADLAADGLRLILVAVLLRCPTLLCNALLTGLNRLDVLNALRAGNQTLRQLGGIAILLAGGDLLALLAWEAVVAALECAVSFAVCRRLLPQLSPRPRWPLALIRDCWRYALGMNAIYLIALLLTQTDKLVIGLMLPLESLGLFHLAYGLTAWIALIQGGFNSAVLPSLAADCAAQRLPALRARHNKTTRLTVYVVTLPAAVLIGFGPELLGLWLAPATVSAASPVIALLAVGFLLNAAVSNCLTVAVAGGDSALPLRVNLLGLALYLPTLGLLLDAMGIAGAALAWVVLNAFYLASLVPLVQARLQQDALGWWRGNLLPFLLLAGGLFGAAALLAGRAAEGHPALVWMLVSAAALAYAVGGFRLLGDELRAQILAALGRLRGGAAA